MSNFPELFPDSAVTAPTPCALWKRKHGVDTEYAAHFDPPQRWAAWTRKQKTQIQEFGESEIAALSALAKRLGLSLWDEGSAR